MEKEDELWRSLEFKLSVERGAIPRDDKAVQGEWRGKTPAHALEALRVAGYRPFTP